jgi:hypothetical protein
MQYFHDMSYAFSRSKIIDTRCSYLAKALFFCISEATPLQRGQTSAGYKCLRLIIINKQLY